MEKTEFLDKVRAIVEEREGQHGSPEAIFDAIATFWSYYLHHAYGCEMVLSGMDVALMMVFFKVARISANPGKSLDSIMDIAGYAACAAEVGRVKE